MDSTAGAAPAAIDADADAIPGLDLGPHLRDEAGPLDRLAAE